MRRIAVINQKGGVGKTTTSANLGAALAEQGRRVVVVDMDAQANLSLSLGVELASNAPSTYTVLIGESTIAQALRKTALPNLSLVGSNIDLSGAELELAGAIGREHLMRDALAQWESEHRQAHGVAPADYVIFDCPPSLGLLSINALAAAGEVLITLQTEFLALQGMSKLVDVVQILRRRLNPSLVITGIVPCLYDSRLKLAREVLGEIRKYFGAQVFPHPVRTNVKLAEAPSYGKTIFEYAPDSNGAQDYRWVAREVMAREARDPDLAQLPPYSDTPGTRPLPTQAPRAVITPVAPASSVVRPSAAPKSKAGVEKKAAPAAIERTPTASSGEPAAALDPKRKSSPITPASVAPTAKRPSKPPASDLEKRAHTTPPAVTNVKAPASARADVRAPPADVHAPPADIHAPSRDVPELPRGARRVLRAEDLPPLPPDAFEILTNYVRDA